MKPGQEDQARNSFQQMYIVTPSLREKSMSYKVSLRRQLESKLNKFFIDAVTQWQTSKILGTNYLKCLDYANDTWKYFCTWTLKKLWWHYNDFLKILINYMVMEIELSCSTPTTSKWKKSHITIRELDRFQISVKLLRVKQKYNNTNHKV